LKLEDWAQDTVACAAGAVDYVTDVSSHLLKPIVTITDNVSLQNLTKEYKELFWKQAKLCSDRSNQLIRDWKFVPESVRLFGLGMDIPGVDILKAVEIDANNANSFGRSYSCGVSNAGVGSFQTTTADNKNTIADEIRVEEAYYGVSHGRNGVCSLLSCMTVNNRLCCCLQFTSPLTTLEEANIYSRRLQEFIFALVNIE
jgi:hypothetical protein